MSTVSPADPLPLLVGRDLQVEKAGNRLLDVQAIEVRGGEVLSILGPNGAGKSTLLRVLAMLQRPERGSVRFLGAEGSAAERQLRRQSGFVFQRPHLWAGTVGDNIELGLRLRRQAAAPTRRIARETATQLGVDHLLQREARSLSGGEAQRVAIARAMALEPAILFLDEPAANLDVMARTALIEDLERVARDRGHATVLATHDRAAAFSLADRVVVLRDGRVVQSGRPEDLFENPADPFIAAVTGAELSFRARVREVRDGLLIVQAAGTELTVVGTADPGTEVRVAYRPEDLFLSRVEIEASPRNRFQAEVVEVRPAGALLRVRLRGAGSWVAVITRAASDELSVEVGSRIWVQVKATALHAFPL
jgi:tungstate transport system ATP-binding protein